MKKIILVAFLVAFGLTTFAQTQMVRLSRFEGKMITGVSATAGIDVELIRSDKTYAVVEIPAKYEDRLVFELSPEGVVTVGLKSGSRVNLRDDDEWRVKIYLNKINAIKGSAGVDIKARGIFEGTSTLIELSSGSDLEGLNLSTPDRVVVDCSSGSDIEATINTRLLRLEMSSSSDAEVVFNGESLVANMSSASDLEVVGAASSVNVNTSSASSFKGSGLNVGEATLKSSSASRISVGRVESLSADGSSASSITYKGDPKIISLKTSSGSSIKKVQ